MAGLTVVAIKQAKPHGVRYEKPEGTPGLFLVVQPSGAKSWAFRFRSPVERDPETGQRKSKKLTLGPFTDDKTSTVEARIGHPLTVTQARKLAAAAMLDVERGIDPTHVRRDEKVKAKEEAAKDDTIDAAMIEFLKRYRGKKKQGLRESTRRLTAHYFGLKPDPENPGEWKKSGSGVLKHWSGRSVRSISKHDAIVLLDKLVDADKGVTANRTLTNLKTFFDWCVKRDMRESSPVAVLDAPAEEVSRERTLSDPEIVALWRASDALDADAQGKKRRYEFGTFFKLLLLTGARRDELREAHRSEFAESAQVQLPTGGTWKGALWTLPASRSKNGYEHLVPLSAKPTELLRSLPTIKGKGLIFTTTGETPVSGLSKIKKLLDEKMRAELRKFDPSATLQPWTPHDLRRTFYSGLQRLGFPVEVAEACVNHKSGTLRGVAKVYGRYQYLTEKTAAFAAWAQHVEALVKGATTTAEAAE